MKRVLITGGAGFIGLHLARHLVNQDYKITILDTSNEISKANQFY